MEHTFILRHQSPLGRYPRNGVACGSDALIVRNDFVFTATPIRNAKRYPINVSCISEFEYLRLEEIRLLGTALLSLPPDAGLICFYPATESIVATTSKANLEDFAYDQFVLRNDANGRPLVSAKTRHYSFHGEPLDHSLHRSLMRGVSLKDFLVLRGLHALLMAAMLLQHREFGDAATIFLHVALEASYQLTLRKLAADGLRNPSALDAGRYIDQILAILRRPENILRHSMRIGSRHSILTVGLAFSHFHR